MKLLFESKLSFFILFFFLVVFNSCTTNEPKKVENSHTIGALKVLSDDTFKPILGTSVETFEAIYPNTKIELSYLAQEKVITALLNGEVDVIISGRVLNKNEEASIRNRGLFLKINQLASDALVFIVSKNATEKTITEEKLAAIFSGKIKMDLVVDKSSSGNLIYLKDRFGSSSDSSTIAAAGSDSAVIEYISTHPKAIGIIGMALVSDQEDSKVKDRLTKVDIMSVQYSDSLGKTIKSFPTLDELALEKYPFIRDVFIINLDGNMNLGTGFANFMVGEKGQRIILKAGLLPYQLPSREIIISNEKF